MIGLLVYYLRFEFNIFIEMLLEKVTDEVNHYSKSELIDGSFFVSFWDRFFVFHSTYLNMKWQNFRQLGPRKKCAAPLG